MSTGSTDQPLSVRPALSKVAFERLVNQAKHAFKDTLEKIEAVSLQDKDLKTKYALYRQSVLNKFERVQREFDVYMSEETLPEGLSCEFLISSITAVETYLNRCIQRLDLPFVKVTGSPSVPPAGPSTAIPSLYQTLLESSRLSATNVTLPSMKLPFFESERHDWDQFFAQFECLINGCPALTRLQKFQYLSNSLDNTALQVIKHLALTEDNYDVALKLLKARFHNPIRQIMLHCHNLFNLPQYDSKSVNHMNRFLDQFNSNYEALKGLSPDHFEALFTTYILSKVDQATKAQFESSLKNEFPHLKDLIEFLNNQARHKENLALLSNPTGDKGPMPIPAPRRPLRGFNPSPASSYPPHRYSPALTTSTVEDFKCPCCSQAGHKLFRCKTFQSMTPQDRFRLAKRHNLCFNCLAPQHGKQPCPSRNTCKHCSLKHHTYLHLSPILSGTSPSDNSSGPLPVSLPPSTSQAGAAVESSPTRISAMTSSTQTSTVNIMPTALVRLGTPGNTVIVRALLDTASQASFISEKTAQMLDCRRAQYQSQICGVGQTHVHARGVTCLDLLTLSHDAVATNHQFIIMSTITTNTPCSVVSREMMSRFSNLILADPSYGVPGTIDCLLGVDVTTAVLQGAPISLGDRSPVALPTLFGHVIMGSAPPQFLSCSLTCTNGLTSLPLDRVTQSSLHFNTHLSSPSTSSIATLHTRVEPPPTHLDQLVQRFWEMEQIPSHSALPSEDALCETNYISTTQRAPSGRFTVRLPFKPNPPVLGESYQMALKRLLALERKFYINPSFKSLYVDFMSNYLSQGHMKEVCTGEDCKFFIPHHGIFKSNSDEKKIRVVFDSSAKSSNGHSLNDLLLAGPKLQLDIVNIVTLSRQYPYIFLTDVEQMFRQIDIHPDDHPYQCILWRESPSEPVKAYYLTTVTYGVTSAPYLALRTLRQLAVEDGHFHPSAAEVLLNQTFVDDIIAGAHTVQDAQSLLHQLKLLLSRGCFTLKKWCSNNISVLAGIPESDRLPVTDARTPGVPTVGLLGLRWNPTTDNFHFHLQSAPPSPPYTKRKVLSFIAAIFDPVGWLSPFVMSAKTFLQQLWLHPLDWDTELSPELEGQWATILNSITNLSHISIPRLLAPKPVSFQLHGFSDASRSGYAAVLFLRATTSTGCRVQLLCSKTRVAPLKSLSIPRLELMGAHLLANLAHHFISLLQTRLNLQQIHLWTDSTIVLSWLRIPCYKLNVFVGNRTSQILEWTQPEQWHHVSSKDNPADVASRGTSDPSLITDLWWHGPPWLSLPHSQWPLTPHQELPPVELELIPVNLSSASVSKPSPLDCFLSISSWPRLIRVIIIALQWRSRLKRPQIMQDLTYWYERAELIACRHIQLSAFPDLHHQLNSPNSLSKDLRRLNPFLDEQNIVRVGGRAVLNNNYPILLPKKHHLVNLLIDHYHLKLAHAGPALVQYHLAERFWIISARQAIRSRYCKCVNCFRVNPKALPPYMGDLPPARITPSPPFTHTGMDYAGPIMAKLHGLRKSPIIKTYLCIFVCFSTKAVHLELAHNLSTQAFLDVLARFISRRSSPLHLYSDCGTNFVGAASHLNREWQELINSDQEAITHYLTAVHHINFHFIPPSAPFQGGLWERAVKSAKSHLYAVLRNHVPTVDQLQTLYPRIEAILNSRPLTAMSNDPSDLRALTPAHFLVGRPLIAPAEQDCSEEPDSILKHYHHTQALYQRFWKRWAREYLPTLHPRDRWNQRSANLQVGDLVLLWEPNTPPLSWPLGRVTEVTKGSNNTVRSVKVKTEKGLYSRPAARLYRVPLLK